MNKMMIVFFPSLILFAAQGSFSMEGLPIEADQESFFFGKIEPEDSLEDCKQITYSFIEQIYKGTGINAHKRVDKQYAWLESLRKEGNKELNIICARDKKASLQLVSCLAFMAKAEKKIAVIRMMAVNPTHRQTDVFCELVDHIRKFSVNEMEEALTSLPKITIVHEIMIKSGFQETDFNPEGCPKETWQGYKKVLKK